MSCYQCGSPNGDESRLCPECTTRRINARNTNPFEGIPVQSYKQKRSIKDLLSALLVIGALGVGGYFLAYHPAGPAYMLPFSERVYQRCQAKFASEFTAKMPKSKAKDDLTKSLEGAFQQMFKGMAVGLCDEIRKECERNARGKKCLAFADAVK